jgi:hypothetical protein
MIFLTYILERKLLVKYVHSSFSIQLQILYSFFFCLRTYLIIWRQAHT